MNSVYMPDTCEEYSYPNTHNKYRCALWEHDCTRMCCVSALCNRYIPKKGFKGIPSYMEKVVDVQPYVEVDYPKPDELF